jgi:hypothetical protein
MRTASLLGGTALVLSLSAAAATPTPKPAAKVPDIRYVSAARAEVRPCASDRFYVTNVLHRGDRVEVLFEGTGGWLAIRPPEGSFSWINSRFLENITPHHPNWVVAPPDMEVDVLIGSSVLQGRPTVAGPKLRTGAIVRTIGPTQTDAEGTWMPIEPPEGEVRYIRAGDVAKAPPASWSGSFANGSAPGGPPVPPPPSGPLRAPVPPPNPDTLWRQAQQAERNGQVADAVRLYNQAGTANLSVNPARSMAAFERARWLEQANRSPAVPTSAFTPARPEQAVVTAGEVRYTTGTPDRIYPVAAPAPQTVRLAAPNPSGPPTCCSPGGTATAVSRGIAGATSSGPGHLRRAGRTIEYQRTYVLENSKGYPLLYVGPQAGLDLEPYLNRDVELFGNISYRPDIRSNYMVVTSVKLLPR